jgi:NAD(P)-dependent dehydrogenase (short-subunit alcohol dehydrogenase family)
MRFNAKTIIITGGTSGLGEALVKAFAEEGGRVFFCGLIDSEGARVEAQAQSASGTAHYVHADVRDSAAMANLVDQATAGGNTLYAAVNNAGISHASARFADHSLDVVKDVFDTNVMGIWHAMLHQIPPMLDAGGGAIVNIASILSRSGAEWMAPYGMSKHAVVGLSKSAALDYAEQGLRINVVSPGPMQTPMFDRALADIGGDMEKFAGGIPKGGPANPADVAKTVLYLASDEAKTVTGANIIVDGGVSTG